MGRHLIRHADASDTADLIRMARHFLELTSFGQFVQATPESLAHLVETVLDLGTVLVGDVDGALVGMLAIVLVNQPIDGRLSADEICWWVDPAHRGSSLAPRLLLLGEDWARQHGASVIKVVAPADHPDIGTFYERRGYTRVEVAYQKTLS